MTNNDAAGGYAGPGAEKPRQPGGVPAGGRFAAMTRREPDVMLAHLTDEQYNADGTFEYPPIPRSVDQHVAFWSQVHVPNAVLSRVRASYVACWKEWAAEQISTWTTANPAPHGGEWRSKTKEIDAWQARLDAEGARLESVRPSVLAAVLVRPLARAAQMARYGKWLENQDQYDQIMATEVDLGEPELSTVRDVMAEYHLQDLPDGAFEDAGNYAGVNAALTTGKLTELVDLLREH